MPCGPQKRGQSGVAKIELDRLFGQGLRSRLHTMFHWIEGAGAKSANEGVDGLAI